MSPSTDEYDLDAALDIDTTSLGVDSTLRDYFEELLLTLWGEGERFSGKRPFGDSGWQTDVVDLLSANGYPDTDQFVEALIHHAFARP